MARRTFESWIDGIFAHEVAKRAWYWDPDADTCVEDDATNVACLERLFRESDTLLARFDDAQVNQGLWMIANPSCSDHAYTLMSNKVPWPVRKSAMEAIFELNTNCFARRCTQSLCHLDEKDGPLNSICYMWWDVFPATVHAGDPMWESELTTYLALLERCLHIPHLACREGALHGLGHLEPDSPDRVRLIIDHFLKTEADLRPELRRYAERARIGNVQ